MVRTILCRSASEGSLGDVTAPPAPPSGTRSAIWRPTLGCGGSTARRGRGSARRGCPSRTSSARSAPEATQPVGQVVVGRAPRAARRPARRRRPPGTSQASTVGAGHVAVAGQVAGHDRRAGGHRLEQHDAERLAAERRRAEHVGAAQPGDLLVVADAPEPLDAGVAGVLGLEPAGVGAVAGDPAAGSSGAATPSPRAARRGPCGARGGRRRRSSGRRASAGRPGEAVDLDAVEQQLVVAAEVALGQVAGVVGHRAAHVDAARRSHRSAGLSQR